jgi:DNA helicase-2/ATP-dependent DNA helicase PcrA
VVVEPGAVVPPEAEEWPLVRIDHDTLSDGAIQTLVDVLDHAWRKREPTVVELAVPFAELKAPETCDLAPYRLDPRFSFARERLHFLVWANRYDARRDEPRWHHAHRAVRLGASLREPGDSDGEVDLPDGTPAWIDGGPRTSGVIEGAVVHMHQLDAESIQPDRWSDPKEDLAADQLAAVSYPGGAARILAPAGSGKTRVLTARLRHLLTDRGWAPGRVTALAYNTRAAAEMRSRTGDLPTAQIRTLHALGFDILGRSRGARPRVLGEREVRDLLEQQLPVRPRANEDVYAPYLEALAQVRGGLVTPDHVEHQRDDVPGFADAFDQYRARLDRMGAIDFDEQIYGAIEALLRDPETRRWAQQRCLHLLVDELQDLTPAQLLMLRLLSAPTYDVFGVGDDDQVIYGYAGADPRFLIDYRDYFPGAASYLLEVNYRCPPDVVEAASNLLSYNHVRVPKTVRAGDDNRSAGLTVEHHDETHLGTRLLELVQDRLASGAGPAEVAVLTRVNAGLLAPQILLAEAGVPIVVAVDDRMLERTGMRAALAWLRLALAAGDRRTLNGSDLGTVVRRPSRSLSPGIVKALGRGEWGLSRIAGFAEDMDDARLRNGLSGLHDDLQRLGQMVRADVSTVELLLDVRDVVGLGRALGRLDQNRSASSSTHTDDLDALTLVARAHPDPRDFDSWLRQRLSRSGGGGGVDADVAAGVTLSTVHRVKGLEWPHVVVWDASEGVMPHRLAATHRETEEERRVFHVALTRACVTSTVLARKGSPSPFLAEMDGTAPHLPPERPEVRTRPARAASTAAAVGDNGVESSPASEALREWRRRRAKDDGVPAFVVLHDKHLDGVARRAPTTLDELADCDGIGPTKLDRYGDEILAVLAELPDA